VAGAGGELGRATTMALAAGGRSVVAVDRSERGLLDLPSGIRREVADTTDPPVGAKLIDRIAAEVGPPAGGGEQIGAFGPGDTLRTTAESLRPTSTSNSRCG
jgi:NAD(P)-dependent dehydrogenase (short-subunit alcohol dehydrogenase family)